MKLVLVGGDERMRLAAGQLAGEGYPVRYLHTGSDGAWQRVLQQTDVLALPYPFTVKESSVTGWQHGGVESLLEQLPKGALVLVGGCVPAEETCKLAAQKGLRLRFYADDPIFLARNAEISAEAAVCAAMQRSDSMLDEQRVLLTGYGLFARAIAWRLRALGVRVWAAARREAQRRQATADGVNAITLEEIPQLAPQMDLVLNTVPSVILGQRQLELFREDALFLELASPPYGIDLSAAAALERNVAVLPGLPVRYAPASAARAIAQCILRTVREEQQ